MADAGRMATEESCFQGQRVADGQGRVRLSEAEWSAQAAGRGEGSGGAFLIALGHALKAGGRAAHWGLP